MHELCYHVLMLSAIQVVWRERVDNFMNWSDNVSREMFKWSEGAS
jgi:hypothetical protein